MSADADRADAALDELEAVDRALNELGAPTREHGRCLTPSERVDALAERIEALEMQIEALTADTTEAAA